MPAAERLVELWRDEGRTVLETHISWVLLDQDFAYKLKKPVDLGFLDFSTIEKRRHSCDEEVRLNSRLAAELYLGVVPVTGSENQPELHGSGEPLDWAVQMVRFPQEALLSRVLEDSQLGPGHLERLAVELSTFHASIRVAGPETPHGEPETIRQPVLGNLETICEGVNGTNRQALAEQLRDWSREQIANLNKVFQERKQAGRVRECHGDLHLGNMILRDGRITVFDCIEFNDTMKWIDVTSDIAFLVMDLEDRGRRDLAYRFLNQYLEQTGDHDALRVIRFYLCYRANVRATVAVIRRGQPGLSAEDRQHTDAELGQYLHLAEHYARSERPPLLITCGPSGSGKSTVTRGLLGKLGAVRVRSDVERKRLAGLRPEDRPKREGASVLYSEDATTQTYDHLASIARLGLRGGMPIIVDASFLKRAHREQFRRLAAELNSPFAILEFRTDQQALAGRIAERLTRGTDPSDATAQVLADQLRDLDPLTDDERSDVVTVPSTDSETAEGTARMLAHRWPRWVR